MTVRLFESTDTGACAALLAAAQKMAIKGFALGKARSPAYTDPRNCCELLEGMFSSQRGDAVVAESNGRVIAFLAGERQMFGPQDFASIYAEPRSVSIALHGYAVAPGLDVTATYAQMYAVLAALWVSSGLFVHNVAVAAQDAAAIEAWSFLV